MEQYLEFAKDIAYQAGKIMLKYFKQDNKASYKGDKTIVTIADKEINSYLIKKVKEKYPNHSVDGEEEQFGKSNFVWVCDPVDGTDMYARHIPVAVFSLALVIDGIPQVGVVYDPFMDNLYTAIKGKGAYKNNEKISVNDYDLEDMRTICHCDMCSKAEYNIYKVLEELRKKTHLNDIGSITRASCCVSTGDYTLTIFTGTKHKNCDIAAVKVIVEEAGGKVTDLFGKEQRYDQSIKGAIVSNGKVHDEVVDIIKKYILDEQIMDKHIIITTLCDKEEIANRILDTLLAKKLASGSQVTKVHSKYWWDNKLEECVEYKLEFRTKESLFNEIKKEIKKIHNYEVSEISSFEIKNANKEFLNWINENTK